MVLDDVFSQQSRVIDTVVAKPCTKFEVCSLSRSEGISGGVNSKVRQVTLTTPFSETVCRRHLGHAMINVLTKFEVPVFTRYGNMKDIAKCRKWGGLGWLWVTQGH